MKNYSYLSNWGDVVMLIITSVLIFLCVFIYIYFNRVL